MEIQKIVEKMGLSSSDTEAWYGKYLNHLKSARDRGLTSELDFQQYLAKAVEVGLKTPEQIGTTMGKFVMGRIGDIGNYTNSNCRFITSSQNHQEAFENGRRLEADRRMSERLKGQTKDTSEWVRKSAEARTGRTKETHPYLAEAAQKISESKAKEFVLIDPNGVEYRGKNLMEFCQQNNLNHFAMYDVFAGRRPHHKNWRGYYVNPN